MAEAIGKLLGGIGTLYFLFDFFVWNGGFVNPSIMSRLASVLPA